jgi:hypothetical protein
VAAGNYGRGPVGPRGRDRQILFDYYQGSRVILPTGQGVRSVRIQDLMPLGNARLDYYGDAPTAPTCTPKTPNTLGKAQCGST